MPDFTFIEDAGIREKVENIHKLEVDELVVNHTNSTKEEIETAVSGLKTKNSEILSEKKTLQESLKLFDGIDVEKAKEAAEFYEKNKDAEFLKDGKLEDLIEQKTSILKSDYEAELGELSQKFETTSTESTLYKGLYESKVIEDALRDEAIKAEVRPEALLDIILRGRSVFTLDEKKQVEARDSEGKLAKTEDDKVLTPKNWIDGLKTSSPHYWPGSEGAGALGGIGNTSDIDVKMADAANRNDMKEYRRLRDLKNKKK